MRVGVIHDSLRLAGGGERVCLKTIEALKERDHEVFLGTVEPTDWQNLDQMMGRCVRPDIELHLLNLSDTPLRVYMSVAAPLLHAAMKESCNICVQTNGDVVPIGDLIYMHYLPTSLCNDGSYCQGSPILRRLYSIPYGAVFRQLMKRIEREAVLVNSLFTRNAIRKYIHRDASVLYPPVEVDKFEAVRGGRRDHSIIACGRFSPEKNFEFVLNVAGRLPEYEFSIVGTVSGATSRAYHERLRRSKESQGLKNVTLIRNGSFSKMLEYLASSRILISAKVNEPFGLSVVEGMAAGITPLVHRSGGPWLDSLGEQEGTYGYSYRDEEEAGRVIKRLLTDDNLCESVAERNLGRVRRFSDVEFKRRISDAVMGSLHRVN